MNKKLKGTKTEQNLINSFAGEAQARNRYTYYSKIAKDEGYEQIAEIFLSTSENELEHAKLFYKHLANNPLGHVDAFYPYEIGTTEDNLISAISGETEEFDVLYKEAEQIAKDEGFEAIANTFHNVRNSEEHHAKRYKELLKNLKEGTLFSKNSEEMWICRKCGYVHRGKSAPEHCPNCLHPQGYFQLLCEKY
ncbi:MAG: rubrerythrin family protein [Candidatus Melainabacteria bacterium]|nr:MAG: rubrerythrin family protein [Candidatus Melainabacteria bacterium]